ncbi:MAG: valine--tRNA ligase [Candidatus Cryosericum sp.]
MTPIELDPLYDATKHEEHIYNLWLSRAAFHSEPDPSKEPFVVMMPPPNVTGYLHIGHALNMTLQDIAIRYKRMKGFETLWLPGMDHAGIATQAVVERQIKEQGLTKEGLGREEFVRRIWEWKDKYGGIILSQLKKLGVSADWDRLRFTLDEPYEQAVRAAFVHYYEKGLLYKGQRITNWCPHCHTAISDIEVTYGNEKGHLWYVRYPFADGSGSVTIATTRPETILADAAVAVNPSDPRYMDIVGKEVIVPVANRKIPVIADEAVLIDFGTGALKITPGHDPTDFEVGQRHNLPSMAVIGLDGLMNENALQYKGMTAVNARAAIVAEIDALGLLEKVEDYEHSVGHCSRCNSIIEPIVTDQWYLRMKELATRALGAEQDGKVEILPVKWRKVYEGWLENINDWCVSRQLWWGHRIPVYHCEDCGETIVSVETPRTCPKCGGSHLTQESDVLDTWFSSALWPFATLGWPEQTESLRYYYPTSLLITGYDIIFFWVARMVMSGLEFMDEVPFRTVFITGLVRDEQGRKMSKSLKNQVDPLDLINTYGTDALRFTMASLSTYGGQDILLSDQKLLSSRNFINKLWNATRFVAANVDVAATLAGTRPSDDELGLFDRWILTRLAAATAEVTARMDIYDFGEASHRLYEFVWGDFCDWYIELAKIPLRDEAKAGATRWVLAYVLDNILRLLHPFVPFVTETITQQLYAGDHLVMTSAYPEAHDMTSYTEDAGRADFLIGFIKAVRNLKAVFRLPPTEKQTVVALGSAEDIAAILANAEAVKFVGRFAEIGTQLDPSQRYIKGAYGGMQVLILAKPDFDFEGELGVLRNKLELLRAEAGKLENRLNNEDFVARAPAEVVEKDTQKLDDLKAEERLLTDFLGEQG